MFDNYFYVYVLAECPSVKGFFRWYQSFTEYPFMAIYENNFYGYTVHTFFFEQFN